MALTAFALSACTPSPHPISKAQPEAKTSSQVARYRVEVGENGASLQVHLELQKGSPTHLDLDEGAERFAHQVRVQAADGSVAKASWQGSTLVADACQGGCSIDYSFDMKSAANAFDDTGMAAKRGDTYLSPPSTWLLHPDDPPRGSRFEFGVTSPSHALFASGVSSKSGLYQGAWDDLDEPPYTALGAMRSLTVPSGKHGIRVVVAGPHPEMGDDGIARWVGAAAANLAEFYGDFPSNDPLIIIVVNPGLGIGHGSTLGNGGAAIIVEIGQATPEEVFDRDWIMTHEMFHTAFPGLGRNSHWAEEGMATYLEPISRARRGNEPVDKVWREWLESMAQGLPAPGDRGLDETHTWGRTYWGGALFWFLCDVEIRKRTDNRFGIPDVFRAIYAEGDVAVRWPMSRILQVADKATGTDVVSSLYNAHAHAAVETDLPKLFASLGARIEGGKVELDDKAPLAAVRRGIVVGEASPLAKPASPSK